MFGAITYRQQSMLTAVHFPFFFSHDGKETKDLALATRRPFTAS